LVAPLNQERALGVNTVMSRLLAASCVSFAARDSVCCADDQAFPPVKRHQARVLLQNGPPPTIAQLWLNSSCSAD
jgi:hypothetical protein